MARGLAVLGGAAVALAGVLCSPARAHAKGGGHGGGGGHGSAARGGGGNSGGSGSAGSSAARGSSARSGGHPGSGSSYGGGRGGRPGLPLRPPVVVTDAIGVMHCDGILISLGDPLEHVRSLCGAPNDSKDVVYMTRARPVVIQVWRYQRAGIPDRVLHFENGALRSFEVVGPLQVGPR